MEGYEKAELTEAENMAATTVYYAGEDDFVIGAKTSNGPGSGEVQWPCAALAGVAEHAWIWLG